MVLSTLDLTGRTQKVVIDGILIPVTSAYLEVLVNDLPDCIQHSTISLFADDCILHRSIQSELDTALLQKDIDKTYF